MARERQLVHRREDADAHVAALRRREHEDGLREAELERERLHRLRVEIAGVGEHGELVARERRVGEDVGDHVAERAHGAESILLGRCASSSSGTLTRIPPSRTRCGR